MRIRYAYKLEDKEGKITYAVLNHIKSDEEVAQTFSDKGIVKATFHERVRTGFKLNEAGELIETGLAHKDPNQPALAPASPKEPKKAKKAKKAQ